MRWAQGGMLPGFFAGALGNVVGIRIRDARPVVESRYDKDAPKNPYGGKIHENLVQLAPDGVPYLTGDDYEC